MCHTSFDAFGSIPGKITRSGYVKGKEDRKINASFAMLARGNDTSGNSRFSFESSWGLSAKIKTSFLASDPMCHLLRNAIAGLDINSLEFYRNRHADFPRSDVVQ